MNGLAASLDIILSGLLLSMRIAPIFAFAPPFSLMRLPPFIRLFMCVGLAVTMTASGSAGALTADTSAAGMTMGAIRELLTGICLSLVFHIAFAALAVAGRTLDIQAGFGLALTIDPTSKAQGPLSGTMFGYAAGGIFFALNGHHDMLRLVAASLRVAPLGAARGLPSLDAVTRLMSTSLLLAFGVAGAVILTLFLIDLAIAMMSRSMPQLNVLVLGFQVKAIVFTLALASSFGVMGALLVRLMAEMLLSMPSFI